MAEVFYTEGTIRAKVRVQSVHPVTGALTDEENVPTLVIRFLNPDGTVLSESTLGGVPSVTNDGQGYYHASAEPTQEGLHTVEFEVGGGDHGREKLQVSVTQF